MWRTLICWSWSFPCQALAKAETLKSDNVVWLLIVFCNYTNSSFWGMDGLF
jgi:hypothetical protein